MILAVMSLPAGCSGEAVFAPARPLSEPEARNKSVLWTPKLGEAVSPHRSSSFFLFRAKPKTPFGSAINFGVPKNGHSPRCARLLRLSDGLCTLV